MVVGAHQSLINLSDKQHGFSEIIELYLNLGIRFWIA